MLRYLILLFFIYCVYGLEPADIGTHLLSILNQQLHQNEPEDTNGKQYRPEPFYRPSLQSNIYSALSTVAKHDELECVPRLLCEAAAGGTPGSTRQINIDTQSLQTFLSYLNLDTSAFASPMLTFGKAALLGVSNRGNPYNCVQSYPKCPRDQNRLLYYLNNHRGGIFRLFDMKLPTEQDNQDSLQGNYPRPPGSYRPRPPPGYYPSRPGNYNIYQGYQDNNGIHYNAYPNRYKKPYYHKKYKGLYKDPKPEIYAKKYTHSSMLDGHIAFPKDNDAIIESQPRIQTKPDKSYVGTDHSQDFVRLKDTNEFLYVGDRREKKKTLKFQDASSAILNYNGGKVLVTDRLPNNHFFPSRDEFKSFFPKQ